MIFQADEATDAELYAGPEDKTLARLMAARGQPDGPLKEIERGYWGDIRLMGKGADSFTPGANLKSFTGIGSPGWLDEVFKPPSDSSVMLDRPLRDRRGEKFRRL